MNVLDIIDKKRLGKELSYKELDYAFNGYLNGEVADYQMSSLLMAICINGMTDEETFALTKIFVDSGDVLDFSDIPGIKVDKHSTGGIGDKTTLVIVPIVASLGIPVIKMSGRGLGYTGGTIDKLESIPGYRIDLTDDEIKSQVHKIGAVVTGQTADLVPMDKVIYALRDVTSTVSSIPLIASSIMSKKIASGADKILIDIKVGNGALLPTKEMAKVLSDIMKRIGKVYDREVRTIISDMNTPLGTSVGNALEVLEAIDVLKNKETDNSFVDLCYELASDMISMALGVTKKDAFNMVFEAINSGKAYDKFLEMVRNQGGDVRRISLAKKKVEIIAPETGVLAKVSAIGVGELALRLGAGKVNIKDKIDYGVGVKLNKLQGEHVRKGDVLATLYVNDKEPVYEFDEIFKIK